MKRTPLKKHSKKYEAKAKEKEDRLESLKQLYNEIWSERERKCYETGLLLKGEPRLYNFHHVLPKSKFPQYALNKENIVLVTWGTHDQVEKDMDKCPKIKKLYNELIKKYVSITREAV